MTLSILNKLIRENNISEDVLIRCDSEWECGDVACDGVWYNAKKNVIILTQDIEGTSRLYDIEYENGSIKSKTISSNWVCLSNNISVKDLDRTNSAYVQNNRRF